MMEDLVAYRGRTVGLLHRYFRMSIELGRLPSVLGREVFRAKVTSYRMSTFEDVVIFVHDVERCLDRLDDFSKQLIARIVLQEHTQADAARLLGTPLRTVQRQFPEALDRLSEIFVRASLLTEIENVNQSACAERTTNRGERRELPPKRPVQSQPVTSKWSGSSGVGCQEMKKRLFVVSA
jgi:hypothetical protein